jgi:predicted nuclease with TOPRIM domain
MFMETETHESKIDVRIIVGGLDIAQLVSKAVNNIQLENDYNIIVSSIIPTVELSIVKKVANGADILLIGGYGHDETYNILYNELKTDFNHIGLFDYNNIVIEDESIDFRLAEKEILNSIIKSTLSYSLNLINIHTLENKLMKVTHNYNSLLDDYNQVTKEQEVLTRENKELREDIDEIKSDFSAFKLRYEDIYSKEILEIFSLNDLWQDTFRQDLVDEDRIVIATNKFKPDNILVGQGYIAAESRQKAIEWLNIVRTALIFVDDNEDDLRRELSSDSETKPPEVREDYEIPNTFENFWD